MPPPDARVDDDDRPAPDIDLLIVGAGITGIHQLYLALRSGFTAEVIEAGGGVGGTWYWNRYPGARFDSESYTYAYHFDEELFRDWEWQEHFALQPDIEAYLNHVVDRFDLRGHFRFGARVEAAEWDDAHGWWTVRCSEGTTRTARHLVAATGVLSVPFLPDIPGRERFAGESYHTGRWPTEAVDFAGKRVAVIGTGSSGVQIVPVIAPRVAQLTVYQRSANWCTPLNNRAISADEQIELRERFAEMKEILDTSIAGFLHEPHDRASTDDSAEQRQAFFETMWRSPGFTKLSSNYTDLLFDEAANAEWCEFIAAKVREIVDDPDTADRLIPTDHRFGEKRPPFVTDYYETFNLPHVSLVDLRATPITEITETGIVTDDGVAEFDIIVWATGFDFGTGALSRLGVRGRDGLALTDHWADGPTTFLGIQTTRFPNFWFPGGPHAAAGNNPRYNGDQVQFINDLLTLARDCGHDVVEVTEDAERRWTDMVDRGAALAPFGEKSYFFGSNIPGKPRKYLLNSGGRPKLFREFERVIENDHAAFRFSAAPSDD